MATTVSYKPTTDEEMFRATGKELKLYASRNGARGRRAQLELRRRQANRAARKRARGGQ